MDETAPNDPPLPTPVPVVPVLSYLSSIPGSAVTVGRYASAVEAALPSAELTAEGIHNNVHNANTNALGLYFSGFSVVELQVHEADAARAREILDRINADDLEPAALELDPPLDEQGKPIALGVAGAFESVRDLGDAQTVLASAGIQAFPPPLVRRGEAPPGEGKRFLLRVLEEDRERAQTLLTQSEAEVEEDDDDLHCPQCGSWRTYPVSNFFGNLLSFLHLAPRRKA